jgi:hypothetical protein
VYRVTASGRPGESRDIVEAGRATRHMELMDLIGDGVGHGHSHAPEMDGGRDGPSQPTVHGTEDEQGEPGEFKGMADVVRDQARHADAGQGREVVDTAAVDEHGQPQGDELETSFQCGLLLGKGNMT